MIIIMIFNYLYIWKIQWLIIITLNYTPYLHVCIGKEIANSSFCLPTNLDDTAKKRISRQVFLFFLLTQRKREKRRRGFTLFVSCRRKLCRGAKIGRHSLARSVRATVRTALLFTCNLETFAIERKIGSFSRGEKSSLPPGDETVPVSHAWPTVRDSRAPLSRYCSLCTISQIAHILRISNRQVPPFVRDGRFLISLVPIF